MKNNEEILEKLKEIADEDYQRFQLKLCPGVQNILGVRIPILRNLAKEIAKDNPSYYLQNAKGDYYEEIMLQGLVIGYAKYEWEEFTYYLKSFIPKINNWAICDTCTSNFKGILKNREKMWQFLQPYLDSDKEFEVRFAIVTLLDFFITDKYIDSVLEKLKHVRYADAYYVKMAIAWTLSICFIKYPQKTMPYLQNNHLDEFTYQKTLQKIIESYRVEEETKEVIRKMKNNKR